MLNPQLSAPLAPFGGAGAGDVAEQVRCCEGPQGRLLCARPAAAAPPAQAIVEATRVALSSSAAPQGSPPDVIAAVPALAPVITVPTGAAKAGMFAGAAATVASHYAVDAGSSAGARLHPAPPPIISAEHLQPLRAASRCCVPYGLPVSDAGRPEAAVLASPGDALLGQDPAAALSALNLRVAIVEAAAAHAGDAAPDPALPHALLEVARAQFALRAFAACAATAQRALQLVSGRSALAAKALLLGGQAAVLLGDPNKGLALYAQVRFDDGGAGG